MAEKPKSFVMEDARLVFKNFGGVEGRYNKAGDRNFALVLDQENYEFLLGEGWNVKRKDPREEDDEPFYFLPVSVRYDVKPPLVFTVTSTSRTLLNEGSIEILDFADIKSIDLKVTGSFWNVNGKSGMKAYLAKLYATLEEDELDRKYAIADDSYEGDDA